MNQSISFLSFIEWHKNHRHELNNFKTKNGSTYLWDCVIKKQSLIDLIFNHIVVIIYLIIQKQDQTKFKKLSRRFQGDMN